mgnify:CR=1 FL=1
MIIRPAAFALLAGLALSAVPAAAGEDDGALSAAQKREVEKTVRDYLSTNPEVLLKAIQLLRLQQEDQARQKVSDALFTLRGELENDPASPVGGNPEGDVTIVEFYDYNCGFCKRVFPTVMKLLNEDGNIRYVFKEYPILGPQSVFAARAALAAWKLDEGKFMAFHTAMMEIRGSLTEKRVMKTAEDAGLDVATLRQGMADGEIDRILENNHALARSLNINGTPGFVIGDQLVPGAIDVETMRALVEKARRG